jgi:cellobiose phosphorylase
MVAGKDAKFFGQGKNSWLTGTAAWTFVNISQFILGIYPTHKGLMVNPCVPKDFGDFKITRKYRGATYNITVKQNGAEKGVKSLVVNGKTVEGNVIPYEEGVKEYTVEAVIG